MSLFSKAIWDHMESWQEDDLNLLLWSVPPSNNVMNSFLLFVSIFLFWREQFNIQTAAWCPTQMFTGYMSDYTIGTWEFALNLHNFCGKHQLPNAPTPFSLFAVFFQFTQPTITNQSWTILLSWKDWKRLVVHRNGNKFVVDSHSLFMRLENIFKFVLFVCVNLSISHFCPLGI